MRWYGYSFVFFFSSEFFDTAGVAIQATVLVLRLSRKCLLPPGDVENYRGRWGRKTKRHKKLLAIPTPSESK